MQKINVKEMQEYARLGGKGDLLGIEHETAFWLF